MLITQGQRSYKVDKTMFPGTIARQAEVAELADALRSGRSELYAHVGSTPTFGTQNFHYFAMFPACMIWDFSFNLPGIVLASNQRLR